VRRVDQETVVAVAVTKEASRARADAKGEAEEVVEEEVVAKPKAKEGAAVARAAEAAVVEKGRER
jgi:hypothetical protein